MGSTFAGLEISKRGMSAQQSALYTTGQNISNANTPGYTRQRVNFKATDAYPYPGLEMPKIPGQQGTGVEGGSIQRIRDSFLDVQFRGESTKTGYYEARAQALESMEEIMNEPSETGLSKTMDRFWQSLEDLAANPRNSGARSVVKERGIAVADTFQYLSTSLKKVQDNLKSEMDLSATQVQSLATQLKNVNKQISEIEPHGYLPNDLYDERDRIIDELSSLVPIKVSDPIKSGGNALPIAEGMAVVEILKKDGTSAGKLVDGLNSSTFSMDYEDGLVTGMKIGGTSVAVTDIQSTGKIQGLASSHGYKDAGAAKGEYVDMLNDLNSLAESFAEEFNKVHADGLNLKDFATSPPGKSAVNFFEFTPGSGADTIRISDKIMESTDYIAASKGQIGNGDNALALGKVKSGSVTIDGKSTSVQNFYEGMIGNMAVQAQESDRMLKNSNTLKDSVELRRQSVSAVSLDEEMTNMIQFQHAYNASARMITMQDELLDTIINKMGL
ncbi:flagellar hook-associated protein FlgK [Metabacillus sp. FJAT-52054]|uniref:Flagellar hook-associated protein 1 n=1 Tax=Metabacillus sediminis TaxID=3117746 RepID=A0ABZ2NH62_9BACI